MTLAPRPLKDFAAEIQHILALYHPEINAAQMNLLDSHDTPRFLTLARGDESAFRLATLFQMTYPGAPCVYYGDEIGLEGRHDPDCRRTFPWDPRRWNHALRDYVRGCISLRNANPALRRGSFTPLLARDDIYAFARQSGGETFIVILNAGQSAKRVSIPLPPAMQGPVAFRDVWSREDCHVEANVLAAVRLPAREGRVLSAAR